MVSSTWSFSFGFHFKSIWSPAVEMSSLQLIEEKRVGLGTFCHFEAVCAFCNGKQGIFLLFRQEPHIVRNGARATSEEGKREKVPGGPAPSFPATVHMYIRLIDRGHPSTSRLIPSMQRLHISPATSALLDQHICAIFCQKRFSVFWVKTGFFRQDQWLHSR